MAFTVEDGTNVAGANSYLSVGDADTYHDDRGNSLWAGADSVKEAALIKATDYLSQRYGARWKYDKTNDSQALDWPRDGFSDVASNEIPQQLKDATALLALEALSTDLNPSLSRGGAVKREKVDVIEVEYMDGASSQTARPAIDGLLHSFISGSGFNVKVVRV